MTSAITWKRHLEGSWFGVELQGRGENLAQRPSGGYLVVDGEEPRDHHWLAVWPDLTLFDPTRGDQDFGQAGPPVLERYLVGDTPFPAWRASLLSK